jgi:hypothetical protein
MAEPEEDDVGMALSAQDRALWLRCRDAEAPLDEFESLLDLAGFADGRLDEDEHARVAALVARDPAARADVAAAQAAVEGPPASAVVIARALELGPPEPPARVIPFPVRRRRPLLPQVAQWASLAAAMVIASWLGFTMGHDFSRDYSQTAPSVSDDADMTELLDPATGGLLHDFAEDLQT